MIRRYPVLKEEFLELHNVSMVANYSAEPRGGGSGRALESIAIRELPSNRQREYEAVRRAIETTERYKNGRDRLWVIDLVYWKKSHTIAGAALIIPCHEQAAKQWHGEFIRLVASNFGLMD
jgi:hypothetical protein